MPIIPHDSAFGFEIIDYGYDDTTFRRDLYRVFIRFLSTFTPIASIHDFFQLQPQHISLAMAWLLFIGPSRFATKSSITHQQHWQYYFQTTPASSVLLLKNLLNGASTASELRPTSILIPVLTYRTIPVRASLRRTSSAEHLCWGSLSVHLVKRAPEHRQKLG